jgi:hypothetical protein
MKCNKKENLKENNELTHFILSVQTTLDILTLQQETLSGLTYFKQLNNNHIYTFDCYIISSFKIFFK